PSSATRCDSIFSNGITAACPQTSRGALSSAPDLTRLAPVIAGGACARDDRRDTSEPLNDRHRCRGNASEPRDDGPGSTDVRESLLIHEAPSGFVDFVPSSD